MEITKDWIRFEESNIPSKVRQDILQALCWISGMTGFDNMVTLELLAQRMVNIYLTGLNDGLKRGRQLFDESMRRAL